ncbi:MAG: LacI family DNA-binding transcriptional regulator [Rhizobiaceae bacterium]|nr:LacI family DNA-binding transcriptional regulator [Rhizobiaceae bacterium]
MATLDDVARRAGVAASTVSRVLNETRFVSEATKARVLKAVAEVGYTPNTLARSLARSRTNVVGLVMSSTRNRFFADIINAIEQECSRLGMMVLLANTDDHPDRETDAVAALHQRRVDGVIMTPTCHPDSGAMGYLGEKGIPTILVDRLLGSNFDGVGIENYRSMQRLVTYLIGLGHRRIGFLSGQREFTTAQERQLGYRDTLLATGIEPHDELISTGNVDLDMAKQEATRIIQQHGVTAFIGGNNLTTIGIMLAAKELRRNVPADLAVVGFDDFDWVDAFQPRLTVMAQPCQEIGRIAASLLLRRLAQPASDVQIVRLDPQFVIRDSCGAAVAR